MPHNDEMREILDKSTGCGIYYIGCTSIEAGRDTRLEDWEHFLRLGHSYHILHTIQSQEAIDNFFDDASFVLEVATSVDEILLIGDEEHKSILGRIQLVPIFNGYKLGPRDRQEIVNLEAKVNGSKLLHMLKPKNCKHLIRQALPPSILLAPQDSTTRASAWNFLVGTELPSQAFVSLGPERTMSLYQTIRKCL